MDEYSKLCLLKNAKTVVKYRNYISQVSKVHEFHYICEMHTLFLVHLMRTQVQPFYPVSINGLLLYTSIKILNQRQPNNEG